MTTLLRKWMKPTKMRTAGLVVLVSALLTPVRTQAQAASPPVAPDAKILVLGFYEHNQLDPTRRQQVADSIINGGLGTALQPSLGDQDLSCLKASCLEDLAKQSNEADYIVGGAVLEIPPDKIQYEIQAWLYRVNLTAEEKQQSVQRQFSIRRICKADDYGTCLKDAVETLVKARPAEERLASRPLPADDKNKVRLSCSKWNFARAATLGASVGVLGSGLVAGMYVAGFKGSDQNDSPATFIGQGYSAIGFGAAALALIPAGLALGRPSMFFPVGASDAGDGCTSTPQTRWTSVRGAAVGLFSGLLASGLVALVSVSANQNYNCVVGHVAPCDSTSNIVVSGAFSATWALGLTLSLAIPSRTGSP